jgi:hypothetical protein
MVKFTLWLIWTQRQVSGQQNLEVGREYFQRNSESPEQYQVTTAVQ